MDYACLRRVRSRVHGDKLLRDSGWHGKVADKLISRTDNL